MKKFTLPVAVLALVYAVVSCSEPESQNPQDTNTSIRNARETDEGNIGEDQRCYSMRVLADNLREDPSLADRMNAIEIQTLAFGQLSRNGNGRGNTQAPPPPASPGVPFDGTVRIPVKVHVLYKTTQQNISLAQIRSQIDVMNEDFRKLNPDASSTPSAFSPVVSDMNIEFTLADADVDRKYSTVASWGTRDKMKKASQGGINPVDPAHYLNIWVCNIGGGILGYAQFPGGSASTDGVVIGPNYFGDRNASGGSAYYLSAPYDLGRTATHEVGHWLNLRHIWGDANCGNDLVADTPTQKTSNGGCPTFPKVTCSNGPNGDMFMNYMDYTYDACMFMFSEGQKTRSRALFASNGVRKSFVTP
ncbi:MAG: zinc metalloprotease [Sphingobacteriaceae bacterium]|nr:zinc metalloprotease [Cytophagaceae bacterium]